MAAIAPLKVDGTVCNDSFDKAQILNNYFTSVFTLITTKIPPSMSEPLTLDIHPIQIDTNGVIDILKSLETHKAVGPDKIPAYLLKETSEIIVPSLAFIFQV